MKATGRGLGPANPTPVPKSLETWLFADDIKTSSHTAHWYSKIPTTEYTATMRIRGHLTPPKRAVPNGSNPGNGIKVNAYNIIRVLYLGSHSKHCNLYTYRHTYIQTDRRNQNMIYMYIFCKRNKGA